MGIEVGLGDADLGALGGRLALGPADVRTAAQQIGRNTSGRGGRRVKNGAWTEPCPQFFRGDAEQDAQLVVGLAEADLQLGDLGFGLFEGAPGLEHVQLTRRAGLEARFGDLQRLPQQFHIGPGVRDSLFDGAHLRIVRRHVAQQGDQHVIEVLDRGVQAVVGRFNGPAKLAPEVEFPGEGEPERPLVVERPRMFWRLGTSVLSASAPVIACRLLRLREEVADDDGLLGAACSTRQPAWRSVRF